MYGSAQQMIKRFGQVEMLRLSSPDGDLPDAIDTERLEAALRDASSLIDSYLAMRYAAPLPVAPASIVRAACVLARHDLAHGSVSEPSDQATRARDEVIAWLKRLADGTAALEDIAPATHGDSGSGNGAAMQDRPPVFSHTTLWGW